MHPLQPPVCATMRGRSAATLPTPTYRGGIYLGTIPGDPHPYLLPAADHHDAIPLHLFEHLAGTIPLPEAPPPHPIRRTPARRADTHHAWTQTRHCTPHPKGGSPDPPVPGGGKPPHVGRADGAGPDRSYVCHNVRLPPLRGPPSPTSGPSSAGPPDTGPTAKDIHQILNMQAPPKTHPQGQPHPARQLGRHGRPPGHNGGSHPQTPGHLVDIGMGRPRQGQTGNGTAPTTGMGPLVTRRTCPPHPSCSLRSAALRPVLGAGGAIGPPPPRTHPSVDTPRHSLHG